MKTKRPFERQERYTVFKKKDIVEFLTAADRQTIEKIKEKLHRKRLAAGKKPLECVIVECDWPMYDEVWRMIEKYDAKSS
jgi:hypothetical protein